MYVVCIFVYTYVMSFHLNCFSVRKTLQILHAGILMSFQVLDVESYFEMTVFFCLNHFMHNTAWNHPALPLSSYSWWSCVPMASIISCLALGSLIGSRPLGNIARRCAWKELVELALVCRRMCLDDAISLKMTEAYSTQTARKVQKFS